MLIPSVVTPETELACYLLSVMATGTLGSKRILPLTTYLRLIGAHESCMAIEEVAQGDGALRLLILHRLGHIGPCGILRSWWQQF